MNNWEQYWTVNLRHGDKLLWSIKDKKNVIVNDGRKANLDVFYRNGDVNYFGETNFFVGLYDGVISKTTTLSTVPGEPVVSGYSRMEIERSTTGWPTLTLDSQGVWTLTSKEIIITASGNDIGPVNGLFLCTSLDNSGTLIGALSFGQNVTILDGESLSYYVKAKE